MPFTCGRASFPTQARHRGWLSNASVCAWQLVGCDEEQRVKSLSLDYTNLRGTLPASLGALRRLEALDLEGNFLSGTVPSCRNQPPRHRPLALQHAPPALDLPKGFGQLLGLKYGLTYGCSLYHMRLQPPSHMVAGPEPARRPRVTCAAGARRQQQAERHAARGALRAARPHRRRRPARRQAEL